MSDKDRSIHPRVWFGGSKSNTCKPYKGGGKLAKKQERLNRRRLAREATIRSARGVKNPESMHKVPGSMNQHKR